MQARFDRGPIYRYRSYPHPPMSAPGASNSGNDNSPNLIASTQCLDTINYIRDLLSRKRASFCFPPSLVFATPPTKDSNSYRLRDNNELLSPNSYHPLSLADDDSVAVVSYEHLLVEYMVMLDAIPLQDGHASASEARALEDEIFNTLRHLDQRKGREWDKQLCARVNPDTFIISGKDQVP